MRYAKQRYVKLYCVELRNAGLRNAAALPGQGSLFAPNGSADLAELEQITFQG
jgi:hypothetical protein